MTKRYIRHASELVTCKGQAPKRGKEMSDNARYMALGNSIAVPCAERVFIGIKKAESEE